MSLPYNTEAACRRAFTTLIGSPAARLRFALVIIFSASLRTESAFAPVVWIAPWRNSSVNSPRRTALRWDVFRFSCLPANRCRMSQTSLFRVLFFALIFFFGHIRFRQIARLQSALRYQLLAQFS